MARSLFSSLLLLAILASIIISILALDDIEEEKRGRNPYSWQNVDKRGRNPYSWMSGTKRARNPYSWMEFQKRARNPYSWME